MAIVSLTIATPCVVTEVGHGTLTGDFFAVSTTGALPTGLVEATNYYRKVIDVDHYNLTLTRAQALAGTPLIATSGTQAGIHTACELLGFDAETFPTNYTEMMEGHIELANVRLKFATTLTADVGLAGAEVRIYDYNNGTFSLGDGIAGTESAGASFQFVTESQNEVWVQVMKAGYKEYGQLLVAPDAATTIQVFLTKELDA